MKTGQQDRANGLWIQVPPKLALVEIYFLQLGLTASQAKSFYEYYQIRKWRAPSGRLINNWKKLAWSWIWVKQALANYESEFDSDGFSNILPYHARQVF